MIKADYSAECAHAYGRASALAAVRALRIGVYLSSYNRPLAEIFFSARQITLTDRIGYWQGAE
jgi:hypothetical protein